MVVSVSEMMKDDVEVEVADLRVDCLGCLDRDQDDVCKLHWDLDNRILLVQDCIQVLDCIPIRMAFLHRIHRRLNNHLDSEVEWHHLHLLLDI